MTQEEKARAYDEALERAKSFQQKFGGDYAGDIFPELRESPEEAADKHIRKVADAAGHPGWDWTTQDISEAFIAGAKWQKEQKPTNSEKPKEWSEEDEDYYDTIVRKLEVIGDDSGLSNNQIKFLREHCPSHRSEWSEEDEERIQSILFSIGYCKDEYPNKKDYSKDIDWLKSLRPVKQEWSEEDEKILDSLIRLYSIEYSEYVCPWANGDITYGDVVNFLKSLRPQPKKNNMITPNKEFFQWIYDRLVNVHNEDPNMDYMISFKRRIEELPVDAPFGKPSEEQMLKEAVEGRIHAIGFHNAIYIKEPEWTEKLDKYKDGDKVLVIVLPKEDEK